MKRKAFLFFLFFFSVTISFAQNWRWAKQFGNNCEDTSYAESVNGRDGSVSLVIDGNGNSYLLTKLRSEKTIGDIKVDGISMGKGYGGSNDIGITSFDSNGRHRWTKLIGSKGTDRAIGLKLDSLGGVYVTANISPNYDDTLRMSTDTNILLSLHPKWCVFKYDTAGNFKWIRFIEPKTTSEINWAEGFSLAVSPKGELTVAGYTNMSGAFADGLYTIPSTATLPGIYVFKYDLNGKFLNAFPLEISDSYSSMLLSSRIGWDYKSDVYYFAHNGYNGSREGKSLKVGAIKLTGLNTLAKFDNSGKSLWIRQSSTPITSSISSRAEEPVIDLAGNVYVLFADTIGSNFIGYYNENVFWRVGSYVTKVSPSGALVWGKSLQGSFAHFLGLGLSRNDKVGVVAGFQYWGTGASDTIKVDSLIIKVPKIKYVPYHIVTYFNSVTSTVQFLDTIKGGEAALYTPIAFDKKNNFYVAGSFRGKLGINGLPAINSYSGTIDGYIARYSPYVTTSISSIKQSMLKVYPNPTNSFVNIEAVEIGSEITLYNTVGVLLAKQTAIMNQLQVPLTDLADGIYLLKIKNSIGQIQTHKIVKY